MLCMSWDENYTPSEDQFVVGDTTIPTIVTSIDLTVEKFVCLQPGTINIECSISSFSANDELLNYDEALDLYPSELEDLLASIADPEILFADPISSNSIGDILFENYEAIDNTVYLDEVVFTGIFPQDALPTKSVVVEIKYGDEGVVRSLPFDYKIIDLSKNSKTK